MASEEIIMEAVKAGGDRQELHEAIRRHAQAAAAEVKMHGRPNDLIRRIGEDRGFANVRLNELLDPRRFVGRAPEQVARFTEQILAPVRARYAQSPSKPAELRV